VSNQNTALLQNPMHETVLSSIILVIHGRH